MMYGAQKSDSPIVPAKPANKAAAAAAESVEESGGIERNAGLQSTVRTQSRAAVDQAQTRIREAVNRNTEERHTALLHHVTVDSLRWAFLQLSKDAAAGVDAVTREDYAQDLEARLADLHRRVHTGAYRAQPSRRVSIPKADGGQRPLGIAALEDKIVQSAVVAILTPIYEAQFLGFSYGFRPGRSQHDALDALAFGIKAKKIGWILGADVARFFDTLDHDWMLRFLEHRIGDRRILRLIRKWLRAGVMEEGQRSETVEGVPQGAVISPLLANIYLHYVYDLWVDQWRKRHAHGDVIVVRFADDTVIGFQHPRDGEQFQVDLERRLARFSLKLHPEKTRLIEFGKYAAERRARRGLGKPGTFDFLGFTHICGEKTNGKGFQLVRKTVRKKLKSKLREVKNELRRHMHASPAEQGRRLAHVMRGHFNYFAVPTNSAAIGAFRHHVIVRWIRCLRRRSQRHRMTWARMQVLIDRYLPRSKILHPWPEARFRVKYSR